MYSIPATDTLAYTIIFYSMSQKCQEREGERETEREREIGRGRRLQTRKLHRRRAIPHKAMY